MVVAQAAPLASTSEDQRCCAGDSQQEEAAELQAAKSSPETRVLLAQGLLQLGKTQEALQELSSVIEQHPHCARGGWAQQQGAGVRSTSSELT